MPKEKQPQKEQIKVTDKRIFTPDGEIREEFRESIKPSVSPPASEKGAPPPAEPRQQSSQIHPPQQPQQQQAPAGERRHAGSARRRTMAEQASNPGTPFTNFVEPLIAQAYMSLGMLPSPYQPQAKADIGAARQMIDILSLLKEKTAGNLTPDEDEFLTTYLGELKLAFVKITKNLA